MKLLKFWNGWSSMRMEPGGWETVKKNSFDKKDFVDELRTFLLAYHQVEQELITTKPTLAEIDSDNHSGFYKWLRLPIPDEQPGTVEEMILSEVELFPNDCLAGILLAVLKNRLPKGIHVNGMSIDKTENTFRFCISGSASLEDLQTLCGQYELTRGFEAETISEK